MAPNAILFNHDQTHRIDICSAGAQQDDPRKLGISLSRGAQYPLIQEYTLNHNIKAPI